MMPRTAILILITSALIRAGEPVAAPFQPPAKVPPTGLGFRGDGSGIFPTSRPPVVWDDATGVNIRWRTDMPNWGLGAPVPVGNRILVLSEGGWKGVFPELLCLDADSGAVVWKAEVDPLAAFPEMSEAERKSLRQDAAELQANLAAYYRPFGEFVAAGHPAKGKDSPEAKKLVADMTQAGFKLIKPENVTLAKDTGTALGFAIAPPEMEKRGEELEKRLNAKGILAVSSWDAAGRSRIGRTFPTPVSDGQRIFVLTEHGTVAAFDIAGGQPVWTRWTGKWHGGKWKASGFLSSLRLWEDLVLTCTKGTNSGVRGILHAWKRSSGELAWQVEVPSISTDYMGASLVVMRIGSTPVVLTPNGQVVRLSDGKQLGNLPSAALIGSWCVDQANDRVYFIALIKKANTLMGVDLGVTDGNLTVKEIFSNRVPGGTNWVNLTFHEGLLYYNQNLIDPQSGEALILGKQSRPLAPATTHQLLVAGGHIYGLTETEEKTGVGELVHRIGTSEVFTLDGSKVATNRLRPAPWTGEKLKQWTSQGFFKEYYHYSRVGSFSTSCPFAIDGDRIYFRSEDYVFCIDHAVRGRTGDDPARIAAIRAATSAGALLPALADASAQVRHEAALALTRLGAKARPAADRLVSLVRQDPYHEIRTAAVKALEAIEPGSGSTSLRAALLEPKADLQVLGLALGGLPPAQAAAGILPLLGSERSPAEITAGIKAVERSRIADPQVVEALVTLMLDTKRAWYVTPLAAMNALVSLPGSPALTARMRNLLEVNGSKLAPEMQQLLADSITCRLPREERSEFLLTLAKSNLAIAGEMTGRLARMKPKPAAFVTWLTAQAESASLTAIPHLRVALGDDAATPILIRLLARPEPDVVCQACLALRGLGEHDAAAIAALGRLLPTLKSTEDEHWYRVAEYYGNNPDAAVRGSLIVMLGRYLEREKPHQTHAAIDRLGKFGPEAKPVLGILERLAAGPDAATATKAKAAIAAITKTETAKP